MEPRRRRPRRPDLSLPGAGQPAIADSGRYTLRLTNGRGSVEAGPAVLTVPTPEMSTVTVQAAHKSVPEGPGKPVAFIVKRAGGSTAAALTVNFALKGSATPGTDYQLFVGKQKLPKTASSVVIPAGSDEVDIAIKAKADKVPENNEKVQLKLLPSPDYLLDEGPAAKAKVVIEKNS